jgi:hypothetical protein
MKEQIIRERLVMWTMTHSEIRDLRLRGFAQELCMAYDHTEGGVTLTQAECAARFGVSTMSAWRYTQALSASGEWEIRAITGQPTSYKPLFVSEAIASIPA